MDGTPDESIPEEDQLWALNAYREYRYRKMFGLSKREMAEEPLEDMIINEKLSQIVAKKQSIDHAMIEKKSR